MKKKSIVLIVLFVTMMSSLTLVHAIPNRVATYGGSMTSKKFSDCEDLKEVNNTHYFLHLIYELDTGVELIAEADCFYTKTIFTAARDNIRSSLLPPHGYAVCVGFKGTTTWSSWGSSQLATSTVAVPHSKNTLFAGYFGKVID